MQIYHLAHNGELISSDALPNGAIFLLGYFDGVHLGHRALFEKAVSISEGKRPVVVWTFELLPKSSAESGLITTINEKLQIFSELGADYAIFEDFSSVKNLSGEAFFNVIADKFSPYTVVCGENFRFGKDAACGFMELARFARSRGIRCLVLSLLQTQQASDESPNVMAISSTVIRSLISEGRINDANRLLGYPFFVTAPIQHGKELGRTIGHPTINQRLPKEKIVPAHGVYSCTVTFSLPESGRTVTLGGVCNIGSRPTVNPDESDITLETYIFDFSGDLYDTIVTTKLYEMLRSEKHFASVDELSAQITRDTENAKISLSRLNIPTHSDKVL